MAIMMLFDWVLVAWKKNQQWLVEGTLAESGSGELEDNLEELSRMQNTKTREGNYEDK